MSDFIVWRQPEEVGNGDRLRQVLYNFVGFDHRIPNYYNTDDFIESFRLTPQEVLSRLKNGDKAKDDLPRMIQQLFLK